MKEPGKINKIELVKVTLPPEPSAERRKRWHSLYEAICGHISIDKPFRTCQRRKLAVVINTLDDGRVVVSIDGAVGAARALLPAFFRAAKAHDKATRPKKERKKR